MKNFTLLFLSLLFLVSCADNGKNNTPKASDAVQKVTPTPQPNSSQPDYPLLPADKAKMIFDKTDYIDYVFYEMDFSMSLDKENDIKGAIRQISTSPARPNSKCPAIGRMFFQSDGKNIMSADIHFNDQQKCYFLVFYDDNKPTYGNLMTAEGMNYFKRVFNTVNQTLGGQ